MGELPRNSGEPNATRIWVEAVGAPGCLRETIRLSDEGKFIRQSGGKVSTVTVIEPGEPGSGFVRVYCKIVGVIPKVHRTI